MKGHPVEFHQEAGMTVKERLRDIAENLPEEATWDDVRHKIEAEEEFILEPKEKLRKELNLKKDPLLDIDAHAFEDGPDIAENHDLYLNQ